MKFGGDIEIFSVALREIPDWTGDNNITFNWTVFAELEEPETTPEDKI